MLITILPVALAALTAVAHLATALVVPIASRARVRRVLGLAVVAAAEPSGQRSVTVPLTERELEIVRLLAEGCTNAEIGAELFISPGTVKNHVAAVQQKVGARNRVGIAAWAFRSGVCASGEAFDA